MNDPKRSHFIRTRIQDDLDNHKHETIVTRFPPEPNGFLHIGHAKSICLNFGLAKDFHGSCLLRYDDTNPIKEEAVFAKAILDDITWLGFTPKYVTHASDYYQTLYDWAIVLIQKGLAYVDSLSMDEIREYRGTLEKPGKNSPYRARSVEENLTLFEGMKKGDFEDATHVLRARIDMAAGNINLRDPILYRIRHVAHQRTGTDWCIYPMYDYAQPLCDAIDLVTHSLCTLEFQDHRPLYDWLLEHLPVPAQPEQIEFSRLNVSHTVTSKRKLKTLVDEGVVNGWDDPRMPTISGMRQRGYPPEALRAFCDEIGVTKSDSVIDLSILEECVRASLNDTARRAMCVLDPLKIVIENYPQDEVETLSAPFHPNDETQGCRDIPFSKEIYIERSDFMVDPPKKYFRLSPGKEVRLRHAYVIKCEDVIYDKDGNITELRCTYDKDTLGRKPEGRKVKGVIHWVSTEHAVPFEVYEYDRLFKDPHPGRDTDVLPHLNHDSLQVKQGYGEPTLLNQPKGATFQFERLGYYAVCKSSAEKVVAYHRVVSLKDTWEKLTTGEQHA